MSSQSALVRMAINRLRNRGAANPPCAGQAVAEYVFAHCEEFTPAEVRGYLKNLDGAMRELREELRAIES